MTDRELLELAAKAAGLHHEDGIDWLKNEDGFQWNPLTDDGDALRLAVKLRLFDLDELLFQFADDPLMDTGGALESSIRRAIVRAAAEIGKGMK